MSLEALERFGKLVSDDSVLQQTIQKSMERGDDVSSFVQLGRQHGCEFTKAEAVAMLSGLDEVGGNVSEEELQAVGAEAGNGSYGFRNSDMRVGATFHVGQDFGTRISRWILRWTLNGW
jgi:hypothetical protein